MRKSVSLVWVAAAFLMACTAAAPAANPAPTFADPQAGAMTQVTRYFDLLKNTDSAGLDAFLSPAFTLQRADGSGAGKPDFLAKLPTVVTYQITNLTATQAGGVLTARYLADVEGTVNGKPYTPGPAPRLSVFAWNGSDWQLIAHSNFNPLNG